MMIARNLLRDAAAALKPVPDGVLGSPVSNKKKLIARFRKYRLFVTLTLVLLYVLAIVVAIATVALALRSSSPLPKGLVPYIGGAAFVALLEFARRLTKDWMLMTLPLVVAEHASPEQLNGFINNLLLAVTKKEGAADKSE